MISLFIVFYLAHLIGDFVLQFDNIIRLKKQGGFINKGLIYHSLIHFLLYFLFLYLLKANLEFYMVRIIILTFCHYIIDYFKVKLENKKENLKRYFYIDQILHFFSIVTIAYFNNLHMYQIEERFNFVNNKVLLSGIIFIFSTLVAGFVISHILDFVYRKVGGYKAYIRESGGVEDWDSDLSDKVKAGQTIGILERLLLLILLLTDGVRSVAFVFAAKSFSRFKLLDTKHFSEYYLIGTMLSYTFVVTSYYLILNIDKVLLILNEIEKNILHFFI